MFRVGISWFSVVVVVVVVGCRLIGDKVEIINQIIIEWNKDLWIV